MVTVVLGDAHETVSRLKEPIDLLFIDADKSGYLDYLQKLLPLVRPGGLILADNMSQPKPSPDFVKAITTNPNRLTNLLNCLGVLKAEKKTKASDMYSILLPQWRKSFATCILCKGTVWVTKRAESEDKRPIPK